MTWTATEHEADPSCWPAIITEIKDETGEIFCELYARIDNPAAIEQMRARARLIVQAEAMRDALIMTVATIRGTAGDSQTGVMTLGTVEEIEAIIKATQEKGDE